MAEIDFDTTIRLKSSTRDALKGVLRKGQTYDEGILQFIQMKDSPVDRVFSDYPGTLKARMSHKE